MEPELAPASPYELCAMYVYVYVYVVSERRGVSLRGEEKEVKEVSKKKQKRDGRE